MNILVLHAGDEGDRLASLTRALGHDAEHARDVAAAKARLSASEFDVVVSGPGDDARCAELRAASKQKLWVLAVGVERALESGADDCVLGPLDQDALALRLEVARRALDRTCNELRESLELNRRIMEAIPGGIVHVLADGSIVAANAEALRVLGLSWNELTQRFVTDFDAETLHEDGTPCPAEHYPVSRALATGERQQSHTIGVRRPDGSISWAVFTAVPVEDPGSGRVTGAVVTFLDLTERKRSEERLRELETKFQQTQKLESLGVLAGGIAHDFNNLLAAILGNASLARHHLSADSPAADSLTAIETASQRAADLTSQMLAYSGRGKLLVRPILLSDLVREMTELLSTVISKKATLRSNFAADLPWIEGDPGQLQQVVMNLIVNASDALGDSAGTISVSTGVRHVSRELLEKTYVDEGLAEGPYVVLEVSDTGQGMDRATQARVFDPFFTTKTTGRGLGLAATLGIVRGHGGAVSLESEPGRGTTFSIYFPCANAVSAPPSTPAPGASPDIGEGTILVVDDELLVRDVTRQMLERAGFQVLCAAGGRESIALFEQHPDIDVVVLDMTMPDMNGAEVLVELRRLRPGVRVVLCSGYSESEVVARAGRDGVCGFLHKPYSIRALIEMLRVALATQR